jgi:hypothetical protein
VLIKAAKAGLSAGACAQRMPGRTKNMVIGRAWRLGVGFNGRPGRPFANLQTGDAR